MKTDRQRPSGVTESKSVTVLNGIHIVYRAVSGDTQGAYSLFEITCPPDNGPPPHFHSHEDESYYVLDGTFAFRIGEQAFTATPGWFGLGPRNVVHSFHAIGGMPATLLMFVTPAGFEKFFDDLDDLWKREPGSFDQVKVLFEKYGMHITDQKLSDV